ncbi:MAG: tellurite resistance TerB family protein [Azoarcus sp.]|jgi:hypothetical protein|nr:tellurite resistance TerB family protein [Azoarcus sp.]
MHKAAWQLIGGISTRQKTWNAIRATCGNEFTVTELETALDHSPNDRVARNSIADYIGALIRAGIVEKGQPGSRFTAQHYKLARDEGHDAPRLRRDGGRVTQGDVKDRIWRTLRFHTHQPLSVREIAAFASGPGVTINEKTARAYLRELARAGYLQLDDEYRVTLRPYPHGSPPGPRAPIICRARCVFDPNTCTVVWADTVTEDDANEK